MYVSGNTNNNIIYCESNKPWANQNLDILLPTQICGTKNNSNEMETVWRFRIVLFMAFAVIIFGDLLGYGNNVNGEKDADNQQQSTALKKNHHHQIDLNHDDGE